MRAKVTISAHKPYKLYGNSIYTDTHWHLVHTSIGSHTNDGGFKHWFYYYYFFSILFDCNHIDHGDDGIGTVYYICSTRMSMYHHLQLHSHIVVMVAYM